MDEKERMIHGKDKEVSLLGIFGIEALELLTGKLSDATDFSFSVIDYRGQNITDGILCNEYCRLHKDSRECMECQMNAAFAAAKSAIKCCPYVFSCPQGFTSIAVPIIVNDQYLGALVGGRVRCEEIAGQTAGQISAERQTTGQTATQTAGQTTGQISARNQEQTHTSSLHSSLFADDIYDQTPLFTRKKIEAIGELMFLMLKEMGEKETYGLKLSSAQQNEAQIKELKRWNAALQSEIRESELRHLRSRLHPQFLLNIFSTISNYAILEDAVHTQDLIVDCASIIRFYLDGSNELVPIASEIEQIDKYLSILRSKYEDKFNYHIQVLDGAGEVQIPVLTLFPLLGFVIDYGVFPGNFRGTLYLDIETVQDQCLVTIQLDNQNRSGSAGKRAPDVIMSDKIVQEQLKNTRKRLSYVYGEGVKLEMKPGLVTMRFPKVVTNVEVIS